MPELLNVKLQKRLEELVTNLDRGAVSKEEMVTIIQGFITLLTDTQTRLRAEIGSVQALADASQRNMGTSFSGEVSNINTKIENLRASIASLEKTATDTLAALEKVSQRIPEAYNDQNVWDRIDQLEESMPEMPEPLIGEDMRNALEALPEGEKLAIDAIEGLPEALKKAGKTGGAAGATPLPVSHWPIHESFTMNGTDTTVSLQQAVGAAGTAIFGLRYNGQTQVLGTDFTVDGNVITFVTFTPEANQIISVSYMP